MQKRKYVGLLEERHTRNLICEISCVASSSSSFAETSLDRLCSFFNSWRRFCNACHGQTMVPWRFLCLLGCLDVCLSHRGNFDKKKLGRPLFWYMGVSKNRGTPKWMVKIMENPIKMDDLGGKPTIFGTPHMLE